MPVFLSHRLADASLAKRVHDRLVYRHDIRCYLDVLDDQASRTHAITALIISRLTSCTNLLALVTRNTRGSWWVPFEVGVARQAPRIITSYTDLEDSALPDYLKEWPVLRGEAAIDIFAVHYKRQVQTVRRTLVDRVGPASQGVTAVSRFHSDLRAALQ